MIWGQVSSLAKGFLWGGQEVGENYAWCLVIVVMFTGLGGAKRRGEGVFVREAKKQRERPFLWGVDPSRQHVIILDTGIPLLHSFL